MTNAKGESTNALFGFIRSVLKLFKDFKSQHAVCVFDGPNNASARLQIYPDYKAHRSEAPPDFFHQMTWAREFCHMMGIPMLDVPNVEADDTMGAVALWAANKGSQVYLCTSDKDMCQLVNDKIHVLNTYKDNLIIGPPQVKEIYGVFPTQIVDMLAIIGDSSDNVPGLPGFGPKTAITILEKYGTLENFLEHADDFTGKKKETIVQEAHNAFLSKELVTLNTTITIPEDDDFYTLKHPNVPKLKAFYSDLNFFSLIRELEETNLFAMPSKNVPVTEVPKPKHPVHIIEDDEALAKLANDLSQHKEIAIDIMSSNEDHPFTSQLVGLSLSTGKGKSWYIPANGKISLDRIRKILNPLLEKVGHIGHDLKATKHILHHAGIDFTHLSFDIMLASYVLNAHHRQHSLIHLVLEHMGKVKTNIHALTGKGKSAIKVEHLPIDKVAELSTENAEDIYELKGILEGHITTRNLNKLYHDLELPLVNVLTEMENSGIYLDINYLNTFAHQLPKQLDALAQDIYQMAGGKEFQINSPMQLGEALTNLGIKLPKTAKGNFSTDAEVLENLTPDYPIARKLLEYRELDKLRNTYVDALPLWVNPDTQRIHCVFNQTVAATGRLSSQDPNLQNIPIRKEIGRKIRAAFKPQREGWSFLAADYSQIELRLLAHLSQDPTLLEAFHKNEDIHRLTASLVLNVPFNEVTDEQRAQAKAVNFGIVYGQQSFGLSRELGITVKEADTFIKNYFDRYKMVKQYVESSIATAQQSGKAVTMTGRERLIPEIHNKNRNLRLVAERLAINTPLQGAAADLIKIAMLQVSRKLKESQKKAFMVLQIHDELVLEVPDSELEEVSTLVKSAMEGVWQLKVPLLVNISIGKNWEVC
jgi:DNA polymerase-1